MAEDTKIEWTDHTFNPWWGCTKVSPACDNCYAESFAKRVGYSETGGGFPIWGKDAGRRFFSDSHWTEPVAWDRKAEKAGERRRVFCGSMCDVMEDRGDLDPHRERLYGLIDATPSLDWLLLTKRPQNFRRLLPKAWLDHPRPNVWLMTTVESPGYLWRVRELVNTPAVVHGLSCEPLLAPLDLEYPDEIYPKGPPMCCNGHECGCIGQPVEPPLLHDIQWVITGGESGHGARPAHPDWYRSLRDQCAKRRVPFLFKQWGEWLPVATPRLDVRPDDTMLIHPDGTVKPATWADVIGTIGNLCSIQRLGKKRTGRHLDGVLHDGYPAPVREPRA